MLHACDKLLFSLLLASMKVSLISPHVADPIEEVNAATTSQLEWQLIVWNDDVNTFDWVITTLMEICDHTEEQATQCAMLIHTKGQYTVKKGQYSTLKPMQEAIVDRGIQATVES